MNKLKKGFTLVELVIVIAVIAVLAAVLLPTFANVIENAKESARFQQVVNAQKELISPTGLLPEDAIGYTLSIDNNFYEITENFSLKKINRRTPSGLIEVESNISNPRVILYKVPVIGEDFDHGMIYRNSEGVVTIANFDDGAMFDEFCDVVDGKVFLKTEYANQIMSIGFPEDVTIIGANAFRNCSKLEKVIFNDGLTQILDDAFRSCSKLKSVDLPDSVTRLGSNAFRWCTSVKTIKLSKNISSWGTYCFGYALSLETLTYPGNLYRTGESTFHGCHNLKKLVFEEGIRYIEYDCFAACYSLTDITYPESLISIGRGSFWENYSIKELNFPSHLREIGDYAFQNCYSLTHLSFPETLTQINHNTFNGCKNLVSVELPSTLRTILTYSFANCISLTKIVIPKNVTSIGDCAFTGCHRLFEIFNYSSLDVWPLDKTTKTNSSINNVGRLTRNANIVHKITTNGDTVTDVIYYKLYDGEYTDTSVNRGHVLPARNYVESMMVEENGAFYWVIDDNNANIHEKIVVGLVDSYAREITLVDGCTSIKKYAFGDYVNLLKITIPSTVTSVNNSFSGTFQNLNLYEVYDYTNSVYDFSTKSSTTISSMLTVYEDNVHHSSVSSKIIEDNNVFYYVSGEEKLAIRSSNNNFEHLVLADDCTAVNKNAFRDCYFLSSITIPSSVKTLKLNAFKNCCSVTSVTLNNGLIHIEESAFNNCCSLSTITIPDTVTDLGVNAFKSCGDLNKVTLGASVEVIESGAFNGAPSIEIMIIDTSLALVKDGAFNEISVTTILYKGTEEQWENIVIEGETNTTLTDRDAGAYLYYYSETNQPNTWHYVNNIPTIWE